MTSPVSENIRTAVRAALQSPTTVRTANTAVPEKLTPIGSVPVGTSRDTVTLSNRAQQLAAQDKVVALSKDELSAIYNRTMDSFVAWDRAIASQGPQVIMQDIPNTTDPERLDLATRAAAFNIYIHSPLKETTEEVSNPFAGVPREELTAIMYDESGKYSKSERYAAAHEQQKQDFVYFSNLFAKNSENPDYRETYRGILDYLDLLSPVEQSVYDDDHRDRVVRYLQDQEGLFGKLERHSSFINPSNASAKPGSITIDPSRPIFGQLAAAAINS